MTDREAIEAHLCHVRMIEQVPGSGWFTPDRALPDCPQCEEDELWCTAGGPSTKNVFRCYRCSYVFACPNPDGSSPVNTPPPGISQLAWDGLLAQAQIDPTVHAHLTRWRLGQVELVDMLAQLAVDQTVRARELAVRYAELMGRSA